MASSLVASSTGSDTQQTAGAQVASVQVAITRNTGTLISLLGTNFGGNQFIQIWDATSAQDEDANLLMTFPVGSGQVFSLDTPIRFIRGIHIRNSSQAVSATPLVNGGSANCWFLYRTL